MNGIQKRTGRGLTLAELMISLSILSILSLSVASLVFASTNTFRYTLNEGSAMWDADFAWHRIYENGMAAVPSASGGMTPTVTTDANGQSRLTFIVPDVANNTTRRLVYYCTGAAAPYTLVEDDPRYDVAGAPNPMAYSVRSFVVTLDATTTMKMWVDLQLSPSTGWGVRRHFCVNCRDF
jgi:prepilin-type N-terminal cleavage/methylation domain-containing protein